MLESNAGEAEQEESWEQETERHMPFQVFYAEEIYGVNGGRLEKSAIIVDPNGDIAEITSGERVRQEIAERRKREPNVECIEREVPVILPAFTDAHNHPIHFPVFQAAEPASVYGISAYPELEKALDSQLIGRDGLQIALGWDTSTLPDLDFRSLDQIYSKPLVISDQSYHSAVANSSALRMIREYIDSNGLADQLKGQITQHGVLTEEFANLGREIIEQETDVSKIIKEIGNFLAEVRKGGSLYSHEMYLTTPKQLEIANSLPPFAKEQITVCHISPRMIKWATDHQVDVSHFGFKVLADGSITSRTALYYEPYLGTENYGSEYHNIEETKETFRVAKEQGLRDLSIHAIGTWGIDIAVAMGDIWTNLTKGEGRVRIEHLSMPTDAVIREIVEKGFTVSPEPDFLCDMIPFTDRFEHDRLRSMMPLRKMIDSGMRIMFGTDAMPNSMLFGLHAAVTAPEEHQRISLEEAVTHSSETAAQYEKVKRGKIAVGMPADFIIGTNRLVGEISNDSGLFDTPKEELSAKVKAVSAALSSEVQTMYQRGKDTEEISEPDQASGQ